MPFFVIYESSEREIETCVSDDAAALRLAASFEAQGLSGVTIQDRASGDVYSPLAFRLLRMGGPSQSDPDFGNRPEIGVGPG